MAALVEGCKYDLSSSESASANKSVIHVKLTDSALRAIEDFQKYKRGGQHTSPTIQFQGSHGEIQIPLSSGSDTEAKRRFRFSLSAIQADPNGSFECLRQGYSRIGGEPGLELMGGMAHKVSVHATDDVYKTTRERMTQAEQESKKFCAQEIKPRGTHSSVIKRKVLPAKRPGILDVPARDSLSSSQSQHAPAFRPVPSSRPPHLSQGSQGSQGSRPATHSPSNPTPKPFPGSQGVKGPINPAVMAMPYRDRVVHLLALRPYKKPELVARLQKDGVREKDKNALGPTLKQVAVFNHRDNSYTLQKHLYGEVRNDWQFYSETDKQLLKRRKAGTQEGSNSNAHSPVSLSPTLSPASAAPAAAAAAATAAAPPKPAPKAVPNNQKRFLEAPMDPSYTQPSKKQRIAHGSASSNQPLKKEVVTSDPYAPKVNGSVKPNSTNINQNPASLSFNKEKLKMESPNSLGEGQENNNYLGDATPDKDVPDFIYKYPSISTTEQRQTYKQDFNAEYEEYRNLHAKIDEVSNMFRKLVDKIQCEEKGSKGYENTKSQIFNEYKQVKKDPKYLEQRRRCDYLYKKLGHIKKLITEYDHAQITKSS